MTIFKVSTYLENYRVTATHAADVHRLAARGSNRSLTLFCNSRICQELKIGVGDTVVDIGCGDGTLIRLAGQLGVAEAIGFCGTEEEAARLRACALDARQGYADKIPLPDASASVVISNDVLVIVPRANIPQSLREIARIALPAARIWVGEIPIKMEGGGDPRHKSVPAMLWWLLRKRGLRSFAGKCKQLLIATILRQPIILNTAPFIEFHASPEEFVKLAKDAGLGLIRQSPTQLQDKDGRVYSSDQRMDYLFSKEIQSIPGQPEESNVSARSNGTGHRDV